MLLVEKALPKILVILICKTYIVLINFFLCDTSFLFRKLALNLGLTFYTPDSYFLGKKDTLPTDFFNPKDLPTSGDLFKEKGVKAVSDK